MIVRVDCVRTEYSVLMEAALEGAVRTSAISTSGVTEGIDGDLWGIGLTRTSVRFTGAGGGSKFHVRMERVRILDGRFTCIGVSTASSQDVVPAPQPEEEVLEPHVALESMAVPQVDVEVFESTNDASLDEVSKLGASLGGAPHPLAVVSPLPLDSAPQPGVVVSDVPHPPELVPQAVELVSAVPHPLEPPPQVEPELQSEVVCVSAAFDFDALLDAP